MIKFGDLNIYIYTQIHTFIIFIDKEYKLFKNYILHFCGINHWLHLDFFILFKLVYVILDFFLNNRIRFR
jgi:hypothetical protein